MELDLFLLILLLLSHFSSALISSSVNPLCNEHDQIALLQLKHSFSVEQTNCPNPNPHLFSWVPNNETNSNPSCCSWKGVTCEVSSGHVTGLDLSYSCLRGPFNLISPIFQMTRLKKINLAGNDFVQSQLPPAFGKFSMLNTLNLSQASSSGSIPQEILDLSSLTSLDLSGNPSLHLPRDGLASIARNMKDLTELSLSQVDISSVVPATFANLTSLRMLQLENCNLQDHFHVEIFLLPKLEYLSLKNHPDLYGHLPEFPVSALRSLNVVNCNFSGQIPSTVGNLINLSQLRLSFNQFSGSIPSSLANLTSLTNLSLDSNHLSGQIPSWIGNLTRLENLLLNGNNLEGQVPSSIFSLNNLESLLLCSNKLSGTVDISMFHVQKKIRILGLSYNHLSVISNKFTNFSLHFEFLDLGYCNLTYFPLFLGKQDRLKALYLGGNNISSEIPTWFFNVSTKTMAYLDLSQNFLTRFEQPVVVLPWSKLQFFDLSFNNILGPLPLPPPSMLFYSLSNNFLSGELSPTFCKANALSVLNLSNNTLCGAIPDCLGNLYSSLEVLNLKRNKFEGKIPQIKTDKCSLNWINLSQNRFKGKLPRSLEKCRDLESLDVGNNQITDTFPSWLGTLPQLQVLVLKINNFHGPMGSPSSMADFPKLRIIDLSSNALTGALPSEYFPLWKAMKITPEKQLAYSHFTMDRSFGFQSLMFIINYSMSIDLMNKGMDRVYKEISNMMAFLSLSGNKFVGEISESIGDLVGLNGLDLSNNNLKGSIPPGLGELKQLESLDLSFNMLFGEIPQQLNELTFLEYLNVSYNNLSGTIPEGGQLDTFGNSSFDGNPGLYGLPLSNRCSSANEPSATREGQDLGSSDHTKLFLVFEGFTTGLVIGLGIGYIIATRNHQWFVKTYLKLRYRKE